MKILFISHMRSLILRNNAKIGKAISCALYIITIALTFFCVSPLSSGQGAEMIGVTSQVATTLQGKDINWITAFSSTIAIAFSFWLVKQLLKVKDEQITEIKEQSKSILELAKQQTVALDKLTDEIRRPK